jgi:hypothetical protein
LSVYRPLESFVDYSSKELRAVEFYFQKAAPLLSGYFHARFWKEAVQEISLTEPAVRYATISLSTLIETDCYGGDPSSPIPDSQRNFALEMYNQAIQHLVVKMKDTDSIRVPLMTCAIFICIDCLRRNTTGALKHIESGMKMLESWRERHKDAGRQHSIQDTLEYELVEEIMVPMMAWGTYIQGP